MVSSYHMIVRNVVCQETGMNNNCDRARMEQHNTQGRISRETPGTWLKTGLRLPLISARCHQCPLFCTQRPRGRPSPTLYNISCQQFKMGGTQENSKNHNAERKRSTFQKITKIKTTAHRSCTLLRISSFFNLETPRTSSKSRRRCWFDNDHEHE